MYLNSNWETSLVVHCFRLHASNAGGEGSIPGWGTRISPATQRSQKFFFKKISNWAWSWQPDFYQEGTGVLDVKWLFRAHSDQGLAQPQPLTSTPRGECDRPECRSLQPCPGPFQHTPEMLLCILNLMSSAPRAGSI